MLAGSHRNAWPDETGTGGRTNRNTQRWANISVFPAPGPAVNARQSVCSLAALSALGSSVSPSDGIHASIDIILEVPLA